MGNILDYIKTAWGKKIEEEIFFAIIEAIPVSVVVTDASIEDNPIVYCNRAFEVVTEYNRDEIVGRNCRFLQGKDTDFKTVLRIRKAIRQRKSVIELITNYTKSGKEFSNELIIVPVEVGPKLLYVGIQNDVNRPTYIVKPLDKGAKDE